jgi:hypothetical protein
MHQKLARVAHRYLMSRLSLRVFYTCDDMYCRHSAAIYIIVVKFKNTICPPPPQLALHRRAALSSNSNGTHSPYIAERTQTAL